MRDDEDNVSNERSDSDDDYSHGVGNAWNKRENDDYLCVGNGKSDFKIIDEDNNEIGRSHSDTNDAIIGETGRGYKEIDDKDDFYSAGIASDDDNEDEIDNGTSDY